MKPQKPKTIEELIACVGREIAFRKSVYARKVHADEMRPEDARHELDCMKQVMLVLQEKQPNLFNQGDESPKS